jgi:hypothetical protein
MYGMVVPVAVLSSCVGGAVALAAGITDWRAGVLAVGFGAVGVLLLGVAIRRSGSSLSRPGGTVE